MKFKIFLEGRIIKLPMKSTSFKGKEALYTAKIGNADIDIYRTPSGYWNATITISKYGEDDWSEEVINGASSKKEMVQWVIDFLNKSKKFKK